MAYARTSQVNEIMDLGNELGWGYAEYQQTMVDVFDMSLPPEHTELPIWHGLHNLRDDEAETLVRNMISSRDGLRLFGLIKR